jgi:hypothetical protein
MEMLRQGGCFVQHAPANNFIGHGFYQFSPELLYRVFSMANGFTIVTMLLHEEVRGGRWYAVADPALVGKRVQMTNRLPTCLCTIARRVGCVPILRDLPQQSDYSAAWHKPEVSSGGLYRRTEGWRSRFARLTDKYVPDRMERFLRTVYTTPLEAQPDCYQRLTANQVVRGKFTRSYRN